MTNDEQTLLVGVIGGRGYVGETLLRLLAAHPRLKPAFVVSRSLHGQRVDAVYPDLACDLTFEALSPADVAARPADAVVLALSNTEAAPFVAALPAERPILDLSADFRFDNAWAYGLPEHHRATIVGARRVSNPGCYATAAQIALYPFRRQYVETPVTFGVSGYSGAGRRPSSKNDPERLRDNLLPYALAGHIHEREVSHHLGRAIRFSPHVASFFRGISLSASVTLETTETATSLYERFVACYAEAPLITVRREAPEVAMVRNTPRAIVGGFTVDPRDPRRATWVCCLDNLLKGAASQATQNLNLMLGLPENMGLRPAGAD